VLARRLIERPGFADLFGVTGRRWLAEVELPVEERESVDAGLRQIVATARKLAVVFWCMLRRGEDYAHQRPALTKRKLRELELTAGAKPRTKAAAGIWSTNRAIRERRTRTHTPGQGVLPADGHRPTSRTTSQKSGRERDTGARINQALEGHQLRGRPKAPDVCTSLRQPPAPTHNLTPHRHADNAGDTHHYANTGQKPARHRAERANPTHRSRSKPLRNRSATASTPEMFSPDPLTFIGRREQGSG
jgi:hypothetical protein